MNLRERQTPRVCPPFVCQAFFQVQWTTLICYGAGLSSSLPGSVALNCPVSRCSAWQFPSGPNGWRASSFFPPCLPFAFLVWQGHAKPQPLSTLDSNGSDRSLRTCLTGGGGVPGFVLVTLWDSGDQAGQFRCDGRPRSKAVFSSNAAMEAR